MKWTSVLACLVLLGLGAIGIERPDPKEVAAEQAYAAVRHEVFVAIDRIREGQTAILVKEASNGPACFAYAQYVALEDAQMIYGPAIKPNDIEVWKRFANEKDRVRYIRDRAAYERMKSEKSFQCDTIPDELQMVKTLARLMGMLDARGHLFKTGGEVDPLVVRAAYLRALRPQVALLFDKISNSLSDAETGIYQKELDVFVVEASENWGLSIEDMGF
jgi:hypothetical protein